MLKIEAKTDIQSALAALDALGVDYQKSSKTILAALSFAAKSHVKRNMNGSGGLRNRTGWLRKHLYARRRSATHYVVAAPTYIAEILERGGIIRPKKGKTLTFRGDDGSFHRVKSVVIPAKHWFTRSVDGFEDSAEYTAAIDKGIERVVRKFNGGGA